MPDPTEVALLQKCQEGHEEAFRELVEKYQRRVYSIAWNLLSNHDTAREIAQEAFLRVFRNISRFDVQRNFYTWLYQITVNLCIDRMRKMSHGKTVDIDGVAGLASPGPRDLSEVSERTETSRRVRQALDRLPPNYKAVLTLRDILGHSCEEIAQIVGCTNPTVRWRLFRARQLFRALWEGENVKVDGGISDASPDAES
jgi:RNA polymerase sigma-70 factor (ECF subfamily)